MGKQIVAGGADVGISQDWAPYLDQFTNIAGSLLAVFLVALVILLAVWLGVAMFTHLGKSKAAQRILGILTSAALAGCLVSTLGWSIKSTEEGGAGFGSVSVSGGEQVDVEVDEHKPKQWTVEDVQSDSNSEDEEKTEEPTPTEEPTTEPPSDEGNQAPEEGGGCVVFSAQNNIVDAARADPCKGE